jgi:hypothetical protein
VRRLLNAEPLDEDLHPWYRGFTGEMRALPSSGGADAAPTMASNNGVLEQRPGESPNVLHITELPVGTWTCKYKTILEQMLEEKKIRTFRAEKARDMKAGAARAPRANDP